MSAETGVELTEKEIETLRRDAEAVIAEICDKAKLKEGMLFVLGGSSSEMIGHHMGTASSCVAAETVYEVISNALKNRGVSMAVQCCEHLNRALVVSREVMDRYGFEQVNVIPQYHAGGAFAVTHYNNLQDPVVVENINARADAGMDIGGVLVGMHIHPVVVPLRLESKHIGQAVIIAARHRPKYVGGIRAVYNESLE
ncbi:MAG: TIGR01440 family protein [Eubacterium sp.]|nr:TIGR01440 family protein [Eubacterium sp.]